ncbi:MAG: alkyl hydroperoxide reductase/Thiol specific antioxidant/Mal allergen [Rickettsiaceae bacterium]|jgi:peroxiredoxin (alkyl hydroperoxide reductase subunit C)|nr:alkyl hydroperoxide reductase/Thiol specific antioxidant/Mal allergen [Rickettsiaceae bacterium]
MSVFIGLQAPEFSSPALMPDGNVNFEFTLSNYRENKKCVVFFYSMDFAQVDPTELVALSKVYSEFEKRNTKVIAISTDTFLSHQMWQKIPAGKGGVGKLPFPLVADYTKAIAKGYGVIMNDTFAMRATFILDSEGYVRHQSINDFPIGRNINEIIRIIDAMDFHIEKEKLCPANWQKGNNGIAQHDEFAMEYLSLV